MTPDKVNAMGIIMNSVKSSNVASIGYDSEHLVLKVRYKNDTEYAYLLVPSEMYIALRDAPSKGAFLAKHIKGRFDCAYIRKCEPNKIENNACE